MRDAFAAGAWRVRKAKGACACGLGACGVAGAMNSVHVVSMNSRESSSQIPQSQFQSSPCRVALFIFLPTLPFSERAFAQSIGIAEQNYNALPHARDDPNVVGAPFTEPERTQWDHLSTTPPERSDSSSCDGGTTETVPLSGCPPLIADGFPSG